MGLLACAQPRGFSVSNLQFFHTRAPSFEAGVLKAGDIVKTLSETPRTDRAPKIHPKPAAASACRARPILIYINSQIASRYLIPHCSTAGKNRSLLVSDETVGAKHDQHNSSLASPELPIAP